MTDEADGTQWPEDLTQARALLGVARHASADQVRRAWRIQARQHHPDHGGSSAAFLALNEAYRILMTQASTDPPSPAGVAHGQPSRRPAQREAQIKVDWTVAPPAMGSPLGRDGVAILIGRDGRGRVAATSRAPTSRLNRWAQQIAGDDAARLAIGPTRDDRGQLMCQASVTARTRKTRRVLDAAPLVDGWLRRRTPATTTLTAAFALADDAAVASSLASHEDPTLTAAAVAASVEQMLRAMGWPLPSWFRAQPAGTPTVSNRPAP